MAVSTKELRFEVELTAGGELRQEQGVVLEVAPGWSPEHLLLAALVRCTLKSLRFHSRRRHVGVRSASGTARTLVTKRETAGRYAMADTELDVAVEVEPEPEERELTELLELAERDCFVGSSLAVGPSYRWTVNGRTIGS